MEELFREIERAKRQRGFDNAIKKAFELKAIKEGVALNERAAAQMIKRRINLEIVIPGIKDAQK